MQQIRQNLSLDKLFTSSRIFLNSDEIPELFCGGILVSCLDGKIVEIFKDQNEVNSYLCRTEAEVYDFGDMVIMPGLIDSHVHINEPGRTEWEGFHTATKAAAAGGFTTICDMPLNSIPPTTTLANLKTKMKAAQGKIFVDVAFWGGVVPGNEDEIMSMVYHGVVGFKCFLCPSGVPEFSHVTEEDLNKVMQKLEGTDTVLAFHAELQCSHKHNHEEINPKKYEFYLNSRPDHMETDAIKLVAKMADKYNVHCHIVHLSSTEDTLPIIRDARKNGSKITVETCHHYLSIVAEEIPDAQTEFKCSPPIRNRSNQEKLWEALCNGDINMVVSDHSPSTPSIKLLTHGKNRGNFMEAWGGISSVQFGLPLFWTNCQKYGMGLNDLVRLMCTEPAKLCGFEKTKGKLAIGYDGDICVWNPEKSFTITKDIVEFQNKANPYMGKQLRGVVSATFVRGLCVFDEHEKFGPPSGQFLLRRSSRKTGK